MNLMHSRPGLEKLTTLKAFSNLGKLAEIGEVR